MSIDFAGDRGWNGGVHSVGDGHQSANVQPRTIISPDQETRQMDEKTFWEIIALFDWDQSGDDDAVMEPRL